jgi:hypothetical protein
LFGIRVRLEDLVAARRGRVAMEAAITAANFHRAFTVP